MPTLCCKSKTMRLTRLLLKTLTISMFLLLIAGFVWYRTWYQEERTRLSNARVPINDTAKNQLQNDSVIVAPSDAYLSSSKSIGIAPDLKIDWTPFIFDVHPDSTAVPNKETSNRDMIAPEQPPVSNTYMMGSKSAYIYPAVPDSMKKARFSSLLDSLIKEITSTKKRQPWDSLKQ